MYEHSVTKVTGAKARIERPADWPIAELLAHIAGQDKRGFRVVDVWESHDAFRRFGELLPVLQAVGVEGPETLPAHTFVSV